MRRLASIDILRAFSILFMVQIHFVENLSQGEPPWIVWTTSKFLGALPAPTFSFLLGMSLYLWVQKKEAQGWSETNIAKSVVRRGLFLFVAGLALAFFVWLPKWIFLWDILTFLGAATVILCFCRKLSAGKFLVLGLFVVFVSPYLRTVTNYVSHWLGGYYAYEFTMSDVVFGFLLHGYFPVLPWLVFPLMGFGVGKLLVFDSESKPIVGRRILAIGVGFASLAWLSMLFGSPVLTRRSADSWVFSYPATTSFIATMVAVSCLSFWILNRKVDSSKVFSEGVVGSFFRRFSQFSLTTYIIHLMILIWPLYLVAIWQGKKDVYHFYKNAVSSPIALLLAILFIFVFYWVLVLLENKRKYSFEGLLRWLSES